MQILFSVIIYCLLYFRMRYVAAYLLASFSGKEPSNDEIEKILSSVGIESDSSKVNLIIKELKGKNVDEVIESGKYYRMLINKCAN